MSTEQTFLANAFETETTSSIGPTDTSFPAATAGSAAAPGWLVIEPDDPNQREYFKYSAKDANSFTVEERYGSGSAAASGLTHPTGSTIRSAPLQQHHEELWDRLNEIVHDEDHAARHASGADDSLTAYYVPKAGGTFTNKVTVAAGGLEVTGNTDINSALTVDGAASFASTLSITGLLTINGGIDLNSNDITEGGDATFQAITGTTLTIDTVTISQDLTVTDDATISGDLTHNGPIALIDASNTITLNSVNDIRIDSASGDVFIEAGTGKDVYINKHLNPYSTLYRTNNHALPADTQDPVRYNAFHGNDLITEGVLSNGRVEISSGGYYKLIVKVWVSTSGSGPYRRAYIVVNENIVEASTITPNGNVEDSIDVVWMGPLSDGDTVGANARSSGASVSVLGGGFDAFGTSKMWIYRMGSVGPTS